MVLTVTPNPAVDVTYTVDGVEPGASHRVPTPLYRAGGKGLNVSRVAHQLGFPTLAVATAGGASGVQLREDLDTSGISHHLVDVAAATRRTIALVDTRNDTTSIFNETGPALADAEWRALTAAVVAGLGTAGVLVGSGSLPLEAPADFYPSLVGLAHDAGVPAIIDTSGSGILAAARAGADLLKPNNHELMEAVGESDLVSAARKLMALGARRVLVSVGEEGMLAFSADAPTSYIQAKLPAPLRGNPTGAGDAAVSAAAVALAHGETELREILRRATAWSAAAVLMPGAGEISPRFAELAEQLILTDH
ncbi:ribokinase [Arthrobacter sp. ERGS1:01]|uniref:1-phosphofructokinase family hexose kinase n=1 Tax=Arthrobacter sp. ERGS1:01 TaxID=1704044 RepID=UPI0006CB62EF|nr:hexose kinase [Arthrobacter sp. ERGS1:01]ALE07627.1 ribokinase [Arthrobacter sp. ERGS1:01]